MTAPFDDIEVLLQQASSPDFSSDQLLNQRLNAASETTIDRLVDLLGDYHRGNRAERCLMLVPDRAVDEIQRRARAQNGDLDIAWLDLLGHLPSPRSQDLLVQGLRSADASIRERAARLLGLRGDGSVIPSLRDLLTDESLSVRRAAAISLGYLGDGSAEQELAQLLSTVGSESEDEFDTRLELLAALANLGGKQALDSFSEALQMPGNDYAALLAMVPFARRHPVEIMPLGPTLARKITDSRWFVTEAAIDVLALLPELALPIFRDYLASVEVPAESSRFGGHPGDKVAGVLASWGTPEALELRSAWLARKRD
jgi:hypothetical protein